MHSVSGSRIISRPLTGFGLPMSRQVEALIAAAFRFPWQVFMGRMRRMDPAEGLSARIECPGRAPTPIASELTIGRAIDNHLILDEEKVSRHHALIHRRSEEQYCLVDLGGINGTFVNNRRITRPRRLYDGDQIRIGDFPLVFRQPGSPPQPPAELERTSSKTGVQVQSADCWLLICDIIGSTRLAAQHGVEEWARICGSWFFGCKRVIERSGGTVADYLGDGFIAYWKDAPEPELRLQAALTHLRAGQEQCPPPFRMVLHFGAVSICGQPGRGEETLFGPEVHFAFRLEKLAGSLGEPRLMSCAAQSRFAHQVSPEPVGHHRLAGFPGEHALFRF